jgi:hypothetical protein
MKSIWTKKKDCILTNSDPMKFNAYSVSSVVLAALALAGLLSPSPSLAASERASPPGNGRTVASLREKLSEAELKARWSGEASVEELAERAVIAEELILLQGEMAGLAMASGSPGQDPETRSALATLQAQLAVADSHGERLRLLARYQALQRALMLDDLNSNVRASLEP